MYLYKCHADNLKIFCFIAYWHLCADSTKIRWDIKHNFVALLISLKLKSTKNFLCFPGDLEYWVYQ